jgi:phosphotriesterase-related protein
MSEVMTVSGPVRASDLGFTLMHEHLLLDLLKDSWSVNNLLYEPKLATLEVMRYRDAGGVTLVDLTNRGLGQRPLAVRSIAEETGLQIVLGCGWYREPYYEPYLHRWYVDRMAEQMIADLTVGIDDTGVRAGIIGELGAHERWVSPVEERMLRAGARAQRKTGVTLTTHGTKSPVALQQLDILREEGVDPARIVVGHSHSWPYPEFHEEIVRRGAWLSFDTISDRSEYELGKIIRLIKAVLEAGHIDRLLLSHDVCYRTHYVSYGGSGYDFISTRLLAHLAKIGVTDDMFEQIMVDNPRRALTGSAV